MTDQSDIALGIVEHYVVVTVVHAQIGHMHSQKTRVIQTQDTHKTQKRNEFEEGHRAPRGRLLRQSGAAQPGGHSTFHPEGHRTAAPLPP